MMSSAGAAALGLGSGAAGEGEPAAGPSPMVRLHGDGLGLTPGEYAACLGRLAAEDGIEPDYYSRGGSVEKLERRMAELLGELLQRIGPPFDRLSLEHPGADHISARLTELLPLPLAEKQRLFEIPDHIERLRRLAGLIDPGTRADARPS